jgi:predicted SAM-dependent methyltransferase
MMKTVAKRILGDRLLASASQRRQQINRTFGILDRSIAAHYLARSKEPKLHIGCGNNAMPGWLNTDYFPNSHDIMYLDATQAFPFKDETFDYIFSEHMIEHIPYGDGQKMLAECCRVLKPSGTIRISTPNLDFLIDLARPDKSDLQRAYIKWSSYSFVAGAPEDNETFVINNFVRNWGHTFIYDKRTLHQAMTSAGFAQTTSCDLQESQHAALRGLENETRMPPDFLPLETLTVEGGK